MAVAVVQAEDVAGHASKASCWVVIHGKVWDLTDFVDDHPGGPSLILKCAGKDGTSLYDEIHEPHLIEDTLPPSSCLGILSDPSCTLQKAGAKKDPASTPAAAASTNLQVTPPPTPPPPQFPPLNTIINLDDFESVARSYLSPAGWAYYSSAADDELSASDARRLFRRMTTRPRILLPVEPVRTSARLLGLESSLPVYLSPTGQGKYAHRDAEAVIARVAAEEGLLYCMPTAASHEAVFRAAAAAAAESKKSGQQQQQQQQQPQKKRESRLFFQLYTGRDRSRTEALLRKVEALGAAAIFLTVDSPVLGKRERDDRVRAAEGDDTVSSSTSGGVAKTTSLTLLNPHLAWDDLSWIRAATNLPLVLKGVQTVEDAVLAHARGADGVVLSNHGGRSQDTAQSPILTLLEIRRHAPHLLTEPVRSRFQVFLDGGIRRGTDVLKAVALGAAAVGVGRPVLYSMCGGYGEDGLRRMCAILRTEIAANMALAGAATVEDLVPEMVNAERAEREVFRGVKL
ncbi:hypothetical protein N3K66_000054 [Trichothecium roseum]|uniref:Uncharacterized protein n=1 Tax=Trichothecium roseum TaxID=47278 RepID=A0ACC0VCG2_9HYPO|nr:hypothetical protein N3K66_000054 [Trichothecium roseum]